MRREEDSNTETRAKYFLKILVPWFTSQPISELWNTHAEQLHWGTIWGKTKNPIEVDFYAD